MALAKSRWSNSCRDVATPTLASDGGPVSPQRGRLLADERGFTLAEVMVATALLATAVVTLANLFGVATRTNLGARNTTYATVLAEQKMEELRALTWGFDSQGLPITDTSTDTSVSSDSPVGGTGLAPSPSTALQQNTPGYVDYVDQFGNKLGTGVNPPQGAVYQRRWSVEPLPTNPNNTIVLQVLVSRVRNRGDADKGAVERLPEEARVITVKTRKAQ
jgi:prepilin-type N-terminal cleavage/methylation domain-containing protein